MAGARRRLVAALARVAPQMSRSIGRFLAGLALLLAPAGCAGVRLGEPTLIEVKAAAPDSSKRAETGRASWYGSFHHGRRTASGEIYDMHALTAAHPTLPLGTRVLVTNLLNGRSVEVRVNDRGPYVDGRIIDLSYAAAQPLAAVSRGVVPVRLNALDP